MPPTTVPPPRVCGVPAFYDDLKILGVIDEFECESEPSVLHGHLFTTRVNDNAYLEDEAKAIAHELLIAADAGLVTFIAHPVPGISSRADVYRQAGRWLHTWTTHPMAYHRQMPSERGTP